MSDVDPAVVVRLPADVAGFVERTLWDVAEHIAGGREIVPGPPDLERELIALMWDLRDALGRQQPYDAPRPRSRSVEPYVVHDAAAATPADRQVGELADLMRILVAEGGVSLQLAASWTAEPDDDALHGLSPAMWLAAGRDLDRLRTVCRQDAARLAR